MIDIHAHIIPGVDDGPMDITTSLEILKKAASEGTKQIVATPHTLNGLYLNKKREILDKTDQLNSAALKNGISIRVLPGADAAISPEMIPALDSGELMTVNDTGRYLLVELPAYLNPEKVREIIFALMVRGVRPIITHPERDSNVTKNPEFLVEILNRGCLAQITAGSITGDFGESVKKFSHFLVKNRLAHIIASDCHSTETRGPGMRSAVASVAGLIGTDLAERMVNETPLAVIEGRDIPRAEHTLPERRWWHWKRY